MSADTSAMRSLHQVHVPKTGGTTVRRTLKELAITAAADGTPLRIRMGHGVTLELVLEGHPQDHAFWFVREPLSRYVSGFNSRFREGAPAYNVPWSPEERQVFEVFTTPNELAEALTSESAELRELATYGMAKIRQLPRTYQHFFKSLSYLQAHVDRVFYVGFLETFDADMSTFIARLGHPAPEVIERHHSAPETASTRLSEAARVNLENWYADDVQIYNWLFAERGRWGSGPAAEPERGRPRGAPPPPAAAVSQGGDLPHVADKPEAIPEHLDEYPDEQADDDRLLRDVPPHY